MRVVTAQAFHSGQLAPETAQVGEHFVRTREASYSHSAVILDQVDLVAFLEAKFTDKLRGQTDGQRVTPFCDLHCDLLRGSTSGSVDQNDGMGKRAPEPGLPLC